MPHLETYNDWLNWNDENDSTELTISSKLIVTLFENKLIDKMDLIGLSYYAVPPKANAPE